MRLIVALTMYLASIMSAVASVEDAYFLPSYIPVMALDSLRIDIKIVSRRCLLIKLFLAEDL